MYLRLESALELASALKPVMPEMAERIESLTQDAAIQHGKKATISIDISAAAGYATKKNTSEDVDRALRL